MPVFAVLVKPADGTFVGWDVRLNSWKDDKSGLVWHRLEWHNNHNGTFTGTSGNLPAGVVGVRCEVVDPGRSVELKIEGEPTVVQPHGAEWPMSIEVDAGTSTRNSDTWYFTTLGDN